MRAMIHKIMPGVCDAKHMFVHFLENASISPQRPLRYLLAPGVDPALGAATFRAPSPGPPHRPDLPALPAAAEKLIEAIVPTYMRERPGPGLFQKANET